MTLVSIVVPCYNESAVIPHLKSALASLGDRIASLSDLEFVLVDDGSSDDTWAQIKSLAATDRRVRAFRLSRNFSHQAAITCGYAEALGDVIVSESPIHVQACCARMGEHCIWQ